MKAVVLAGGFGTRISEESHLRPKPMVEIGDSPILWRIVNITLLTIFSTGLYVSE
jgi:glucose-1-phosphate cytidylyltransferase